MANTREQLRNASRAAVKEAAAAAKPPVKSNAIRIEKCGGRKDQNSGLITSGWRFVVVQGSDNYLACFQSQEYAKAFVEAIQ
jgi:hypothetical protein